MSTTRAHWTSPTPSDLGADLPMSEPTFLQVQGGGSSTWRMIELPLGPVRVGRGSHCEIQLDGEGLGDVQCMLRRRGSHWHLQLVGPPGQVWVEGRAADQQRPIPLGVPFRVGEHWLTLRPADSAINDWGTYDSPISVEPVPTEIPTPASPSPSPSVEPPDPSQDRPRQSSTPIDDKEARLRRWETRLEQRERWLKDRQDERRWEARWKSAGESIRGRTAPLPSQSITPSKTPRATPPPPPAPTPRTHSRPTQTPPVARIIETRRPEPTRRVAEPPRPTPPRVEVRRLSDSVALAREPLASKLPRTDPRTVESVAPETPSEPPEPPMSRALVWLTPSPGVIASTSEESLAEAPCPGPMELASEVEGSMAGLDPVDPLLDEVSSEVDLTGWEGRLDIDSSTLPVVSAEADPIGVHPEPDSFPTAGSSLFEGVASEQDEVPLFVEASATLPSPAELSPRPDREMDPGRAAGFLDEPELIPVASPSRGEFARAEWPSARAIFNAQGRRVQNQASAPKPDRRKTADPRPTEVIAPRSWSIPGWLGVLPVLALTTVLGVAGIGLACEWAVGANEANLAIRSAVRAEGSPGPTLDPASIPRGGWWTTSAPHLSAWAMALVRSGDGEDHAEEIRSLLESAKHASQLGSRSRFVVEMPASAEPGASADLANLGRSRDVVTLVWAGQRLKKAGKLEQALRAYRSAMEMASKTRLNDLDPPTFYEDPQVRRYALPREGLIGLVVKAMADDGSWGREQWEEAMPPTSTASVVASRAFALRQDRAEADRLADRAILQADSPTPPGFDEAEDRAARAEALAARGRWTDAAEQYRLAIDQAEDDATRRRWWLNLAEVAQRNNDDVGRARAIEAAKSPTTVDEVTRRALKYQQGLSGLVTASPRP